MSVLDDDSLPEFSKTKEMLLGDPEKQNSLFVTHKFHEIIHDFGGRMCKSFHGFAFKTQEKEEDPRQIKSWPVTPDNEDKGPIEALPDPYPDNVYSVGLTAEEMRQMKYLSKQHPHKPIQTDHYDADQNLRKDALLVGHQRELLEVEKSIEKKKQRGRQNRYIK